MLVFVQSHAGHQFLHNSLMLPQFARGGLSKADVGWGAWQGCIFAVPCNSSKSKHQEELRHCIFLSPAACYLTGNSCCFPPAGQAALASRQALLGYFSGTMSTVQPVTYQGEMLHIHSATSQLCATAPRQHWVISWSSSPGEDNHSRYPLCQVAAHAAPSMGSGRCLP